jgi:hypothetical protein
MALEGIHRLARALEERMKHLDERPPLLDFGQILDDMSLITNKFPRPIPQADYMVCRSVQWGPVDAIFYHTQHEGRHRSGEHTHVGGGHSHPDAGFSTHVHATNAESEHHIQDTLIGPKFRWLIPGDRVLVAWVGDDACVVDIIYPATRIGRNADSYERE